MKFKGYRFGVQWIAWNDEDGDTTGRLDVEVVSAYISTGLLADLCSKTQEDVAKDIIRYRNKQDRLALVRPGGGR